jgi:hypothetical protein
MNTEPENLVSELPLIATVTRSRSHGRNTVTVLSSGKELNKNTFWNAPGAFAISTLAISAISRQPNFGAMYGVLCIRAWS